MRRAFALAVSLGSSVVACGPSGPADGDQAGGDESPDLPSDDAWDPWLGEWHWIDPLFAIGEGISWESGGDGIVFNNFSFRSDHTATLTSEGCRDHGPPQEDFTWEVGDAGYPELIPVSGEHEFNYTGKTKTLLVKPDDTCGTLVIWQILTDDSERALFGDAPLERGTLCLGACAEPNPLVDGIVEFCDGPPGACED